MLKYYKSLKSEKLCENLSYFLKILIKSEKENISYLLYLKVTESLFEYFGKEEEKDSTGVSSTTSTTNISNIGEIILSNNYKSNL